MFYLTHRLLFVGLLEHGGKVLAGRTHTRRTVVGLRVKLLRHFLDHSIPGISQLLLIFFLEYPSNFLVGFCSEQRVDQKAEFLTDSPNHSIMHI